MKVTVNRQLAGGIYFVGFRISEFTPEESQKMQSFGVPKIKLQYNAPGGARAALYQPITQITEQAVGGRAGFPSGDEAKSYEQDVLEQLRAAMDSLRERKDDFSSTEEVAF